MDKESLRREILAKLSSLHRDQVIQLSMSLTEQVVKLFSHIPNLSSQIGAGYLPFKTEIAPVYQELFRRVPLNLSYPILIDGEMKFGIPNGIPRGSTWLDQPYSVVTPSWLFVPGVGFDLNGARLGRGKGFYDRYLESNEAVKIGLCWSEQLKESIPVESHDSHMDFIITENFCFDVSGQRKF